jgi:thymidylate kinase
LLSAFDLTTCTCQLSQTNKAMISPLPITFQLRTALQEARVGFALWKSNHHIEEAIAGKTDLDLLVAPQHSAKFANVIRDLKAIKVLSQPWARYPNVEDWLVFDSMTGGFLHLHVHFDMVTGLKRIKHLRLPWADAVLANLRIDERSGWPIPTAEMELLILLVRIWAKMPPWRRLFAPKIPPYVKEEVRWLESEVQTGQLSTLAKGLGLTADIHLPLGGDAAVIALARHLCSQVSQHYRMSWRTALMRAAMLNLKLALARFWLRHIGPIRYRKTLTDGGAMIAFIGSDGSGKSTVSQSLEQWLRRKLDVHLIYMGSGDGRAGWINAVRRLLSAIVSKRAKPDKAKNEVSLPRPVSFAEKTYRLFDFLLLRRKLRFLRLGRRLADRGSVILFDRYPQSQFEAISDGPRLQNGRSFAWAAESERRLFAEAARLGPDLVIKLRIDPEIALLRKPDHKFETIRRKCAITDALQFPGSSVNEIDAGQSLEDVLRAAKRAIWAHMAKAERS